MSTPPPALRARRILDRLKRGVPPAEGIDELVVGMEQLEARFVDLLSGGAGGRWMAVQSEYGEGKSHFHTFARQRALGAGYAAASLDVNKDEGALHHPQRHLAVLLDSIRSPLDQFANVQGVGGMVRAWLETASAVDVRTILRHCLALDPDLPAGRDPSLFRTLATRVISGDEDPSARRAHQTGLVRYMTGEDLLHRSPMARFAAAYRMQLIQRWLLGVGHRGLLLFVDEIDNVVRQIHTRGHPGCFRTLAWYCASPALSGTRVVFASTPEVLEQFDDGGGKHYLQSLQSQATVPPAEAAAFRRWLGEVHAEAAAGWVRCPRLTASQRLDLFTRIARVYRTAWGRAATPPKRQLDELSRNPQFSTTRRWVRAAVQIIECLTQAQAEEPRLQQAGA